MAYGNLLYKLIGAGTFNFTQGNAAGNQISLTTIIFGAHLQTGIVYYAQCIFTTATTNATRTISVGDSALGSIAAWPAALAVNNYLYYNFACSITTANLFTFGVGTGSTSTNLVGSYRIFAWGKPNL